MPRRRKRPTRTWLEALPFVAKLADGEAVEGGLFAQLKNVGDSLARRNHRFRGGNRSQHGNRLTPFGDRHGLAAAHSFEKRRELVLRIEGADRLLLSHTVSLID